VTIRPTRRERERPNFGRTGTTGRRCSRSTGACRVQPQGNVSGIRLHNVNDRGEYRLYGISPGSYYLLAGISPGPLGRQGASGLSTAIYALSFYPGVTDVSPGGGIESEEWIRSRRRHESAAGEYYRVRGHVIDSRQPGSARADISLNDRNLTERRRLQLHTELQSSDRNLELRDVIPGQYIVQAQIQERTRRAPPVQ